MKVCPYYKESFWNYLCTAIDEEGKEITSRYNKYCGAKYTGGIFREPYDQCPLYKDAQARATKDSGCYLTSACMSAHGVNFYDDCKELTILRKFRDTYLKDKYPDKIKEYYNIAPLIVTEINKEPDNNTIFKNMYEHLVSPCCDLIEKGLLEEAYNKYKEYTYKLYNKYIEKK